MSTGKPFHLTPRDQDGFSLIETMVAVGIAAIVSTAFVTLMSNMHNETRSISDKVEALDLERQLGQLYSDNSLCTCAIANQGALVADPTPVSGPPTFHLDLPKLISSCADSNSVFAVKGQRMFAGANSLIVKAVGVRFVTPTGPADRDGNQNFSGSVTIDFEPTPTGRQMKGIKTSKIFTAKAKRLTSCFSAPTGGGGGGGMIEYYQGTNQTGGTSAASSPRSGAWCPSGYRATGGGLWTDSIIRCSPATLLESRMVQHTTGVWGWVVRATCQTYHAVVACQREF